MILYLFILSVFVPAVRMLSPPQQSAFIRPPRPMNSIVISNTRRPSCRLCLRMQTHPSNNDSINEEKSSLWYSYDQIQSLSKLINITPDDLHVHHIDVVYYTSSPTETECKSTSYYRIRSGSEVYSVVKNSILEVEPISSQTILHAENAVSATYRWCSDFVKDLNLCPWAKQSLLSENAIRIKVVNQSDGLDEMERIVRESSFELKDLTERGFVDPYIGISFIISLPDCGTSKNDNIGFDFMSFYDFYDDLEEQFINEIIDETDIYLGDEVTIAPFHPRWSFAPSSDNGLDKIIEDPINYEKRTPFPTISVVMSKGIDLAGEETTSRIGIHNEETLSEMGFVALKQLYNNKVLKEPID